MSSLVRILPISVAVSFAAYTIRKNRLNMHDSNITVLVTALLMTLVKRNRDDQQHANAFDLQNNTCLYQNLPRIFDKSKLQNCPYDDKIQRLALGLSQATNRTGHWTKTSQFEFISNMYWYSFFES